MRRISKLAALLLTVAAITACSTHEPAVLEAESLEQAQSLAAAHDALIVIDFWRQG